MDNPTKTDVGEIVARLQKMLAKATGEQHGASERSRPLPWEVWTSCSFRRVKTAPAIGRDGGLDVLSAYQCRDGGLDLSMPEDRLVALIDAVNALPDLLTLLTSQQSEITRLTQEVGTLREALEPFAQAGENASICGRPPGEFVDANLYIKARATLTGHPTK